MIVLISPTKTMEASTYVQNTIATTPVFLEEAKEINAALSKWDKKDLMLKMKLSEKLANTTLRNLKIWSSENPQNREAIFSYKGTAFKHMNTNLWNDQDLVFSQKNMLILSAYYGLLRPFDTISTYRLELGIKHQVLQSSKNMYAFWRDKITHYLNQHEDDIILNLASKEYSQVISIDKLNKKWINCDFYEIRNGDPKIVGNYAKAARGLMVNYIVKNKITSILELMKFSEAKYKFDIELSTAQHLKFVR